MPLTGHDPVGNVPRDTDQKETHMVRMFGPSVALSVIALIVAAALGGPEVFVAVLVLAILEISLSFDNAVVNAKVLVKMSEFWQKIFLTVGILIAVFGMRLVLPVIIVAISTGLSPMDAWNLALNDPERYSHVVEGAKYAIYAFGGIFLLMIFLDMFLDEDKDVHWLAWLERPLAKIGKLDTFSVVLALLALYGASLLAPDKAAATVLVSGVFGLIVYLGINALNTLMESDEDDEDDIPMVTTKSGNQVKTAGTAGFAAFMYLELLDASFSLDGVVGAFAISSDILVIALGLGIGAFWVRSMTIYLVRKGTLAEFVYLEHGAHWAIGCLAAIMLLEMKFHISEYVTGLLGVVFIIFAVISSLKEKRRAAASIEPVGVSNDTTIDGVDDVDPTPEPEKVPV